MSPQSIPVSEGRASIRTCLFAGAANRFPAERVDFDSFSEFAGALEELTTREAEALKPEPDESREEHAKRVKRSLPYLAPYHLPDERDKSRCDANVSGLTLLMGDVDACDLNALIDRMFELDVDGVIYGSPSDSEELAADKRRVRVVVPVSREILPQECSASRLAFAELLGLAPGCGADMVSAPSIGFFAGRMPGAPERDFYHFEGGKSIDVDALLARPLAHAWGTPGAHAGAERGAADKSPLPPIGEVDPRDAETLEALLALHLPAGTDPDRRMRLRATGNYLAQRGLSEERIAALVSRVPTARGPQRSVAEAIGGARDHRAGVANVVGWQMLQALNPEAAATLERATEGGFERRAREKREAQARTAAANPDDVFAPAADNAEIGKPYILQSATHSDTILLWRGADRGHQPVALGSLRLVIKDSALDDKMPLYDDVETKSGESKKVKVPAPVLVERHGEHFDHTTYDFARRVSEYDRDRSRVIVGYPDVCTAGMFDSDVDAWLKALAGEAYPRLEAWIASCAQQNIDRLAAALVLTGPADLGKSLFSCAVAGLWGAVTPPAAALLIKQFNGELKKCAVVCDEEAQLFGSKQLSTKRFRDLTQSTERSIELKGLETFTLRGALRIIVPCNEISDLRFTDLGGPDIVNAVIDRLCVINSKPRAAECRAALARLRLPGGWVCDRDRVIAHMAWLCETVELPAERFIGAVAGAESVLAGHVDDHVDLWEKFREWLESDGAGGTLWKAINGRLCVDPKALAMTLESTGKGWDQKRVQDGLAPFHVGHYKPRLEDGAQPRLWTLDPGAVMAALALDAREGTKLTKRVAASEPKPQSRDPHTNKFKR